MNSYPNYFLISIITLLILFITKKQQSVSAFTVQVVVTPTTPLLSLSSKSHVNKTSLQMAGFGGGGGGNTSSSKGGKKKGKSKVTAPLVLKPKQQWDRYGSLKAFNAVKVGVRVVKVKENDGDGNENEWLEAGKVKSENDESIEIAIALQRGLIAEVCRMYK